MQGEQTLSSVHSLRQDQMEAELVGFIPGKSGWSGPYDEHSPGFTQPAT